MRAMNPMDYKGILRRRAIKRQLRKAGLTIAPCDLLNLQALRGLRRWWFQSGTRNQIQTYQLFNS